MNWELMTVAILAGAANWAFRALPILVRADKLSAGGTLERFLSATGPAAIATLFVAAILPAASKDVVRLMPEIAGVIAVLAVFRGSQSVAFATLAGAFAHGMTVWMLA
jgi:branched-subunit amino acid transport protein